VLALPAGFDAATCNLSFAAQLRRIEFAEQPTQMLTGKHRTALRAVPSSVGAFFYLRSHGNQQDSCRYCEGASTRPRLRQFSV
jgi:hypothetical protein